MVKKLTLAAALALLASACATLPPPAPPPFHIESIPPAVTGTMTLEERITAEEAWEALRAGRGDRAETLFVRLGVESAVGRAGLGYVAFLREELATAQEEFQEAIRLRPDFVPARVGLAQIYELTGEDDQLFTQYQEILKAEPGHPWAAPRLENLRVRKSEELRGEAAAALSAGDLEQAKKVFLTILFFDPASVDAHLQLARVYRREGNSPSALVHLKAAVDAAPENKSVWSEYAEALAEAEQFGRSLEAYERVTKIDPEDEAAAKRLESLKSKMGVFEVPSLYDTIPAAASVTREQLAALVAVKFSADLDGGDSKPPIIIDIGTSWAQKMILQVAALGLMDVYDNHTFLPRQELNRAEFAEVVLRLMKLLQAKGYRLIAQIPADRIRVTDVPPDSYYHEAVVQALSYQVMELVPGGTFGPGAALTGAEAIRALDTLRALIR